MDTKEKIIRSAKQLIRQYGYRNMTMEKIAELSGVPKGSITYHFKKEELVLEIFRELFEQINQAVARDCGEKIENRFQFYLLHTRIFVSIVFKEQNIIFLFEEMLASDILIDAVRNYIKMKLSYSLEDFGYPVDPSHFEQQVEAELGASIFTMQQHLEDLYWTKSLDFLDFISTISIQLSGIPKEYLDEQVMHVHQLHEMVDCSEIEFIQNNF